MTCILYSEHKPEIRMTKKRFHISRWLLSLMAFLIFENGHTTNNEQLQAVLEEQLQIWRTQGINKTVNGKTFWLKTDNEYFPGLYSVKIIKGEKALFLVHVSKYWDQDMISRNAVDQYTAEFLNNNDTVVTALYPSAYLNDNEQLNGASPIPQSPLDTSYFPQHQRKTTVLPYDGNYHHIIFETTELTMMGGASSFCFCNALNSVLYQSDSVKKINLVMSGIYAPLFPKGKSKEWAGVENIPLEAPKFSDDMFYDRTMYEVSRRLSDQEFFSYIYGQYFNKSQIGILFCSNGFSYIENATYQKTIKVYRNDQYLGEFGSGPIIKLNYVD